MTTQSSKTSATSANNAQFQIIVPSSSKRAFDSYMSKAPQNAGLIFDRFAPDTCDNDNAKKTGFEWVKQAAKKSDMKLWNALKERWELGAEYFHAKRFCLKTDWRFITGLGRKGPLEAGFTFNRYGFPILPASSVKGIARAFALYEVADSLQDRLDFVPVPSSSKEKPLYRELDKATPLVRLDQILTMGKEEKYQETFRWYYGENPRAFQLASDFRTVFGTTDSAGMAVFLDAIPTHVPKLEIDIMNPHFPEYYQGEKPPTDWQSPRPVFFLTVAPDTEFCFAVGWRGMPDENLQAKAFIWLKQGLLTLGAGAKTSAGYGFFREEEELPKQALSQQSAVSSPASAPVPTERPSTRHTATGKVKYDGGKAYVVDEEGKWRRVRWNELGMRDLPAKTLVEIEYEQYEDGYKVIRVTKK